MTSNSVPAAEHVVLTAIGEDRPGLVEALTEFVLQRGGSIEESRMVNLMGRFAMIVLIMGDAAAIERDLDVLDMDARVSHLKPSEPVVGVRYRIHARALDQPGLVHEVAEVFREHGANIESLSSTLEAAPTTGSPIFAMDIDVTVAAGHQFDHFERDLAAACDAAGIDSSIIAVDV